MIRQRPLRRYRLGYGRADPGSTAVRDPSRSYNTNHDPGHPARRLVEVADAAVRGVGRSGFGRHGGSGQSGQSGQSGAVHERPGPVHPRAIQERCQRPAEAATEKGAAGVLRLSAGPPHLRYVGPPSSSGLPGVPPGVDHGTDQASPGDERPCQRCIKRGLQDACHDGLRKKVKYLRDAPGEALVPGVVQPPGSQYYRVPGYGGDPPVSPQQYPGPAGSSLQRRPPSFDPYPVHARVPLSFPEPPLETPIYSTQQSPLTGQFPPTVHTHDAAMQSMAGVLQQSRPMPPFPSAFDPNDPNPYNFDPASYNFGNHYGALEFGMLGHMSSGAAETPPTDLTPQLTHGSDLSYTTPGPIPTPFSSSPVTTQQAYVFSASHQQHQHPHPQHPPTTESVVHPTSSAPSNAGYPLGQYPNGPIRGGVPYAFTVSQPSDFSSPPTSRSQSVHAGTEDLSDSSNIYNSTDDPHARPIKRRAPQFSATSATSYLAGTPNHSLHQSLKSPSEIYSSFTEPYPYTDGFHSLITYLQARFPPSLTLRIAKALASIRPSFISCTSNLTREDLVFMEKQFQRCLYQYEGSIERCGTPTLVLRRTGEIAAVGVEFSILTGWTREVLLGWERNRNVNCVNGRRRRAGRSAADVGPNGSAPTAAPSEPGFQSEEATASATVAASAAVAAAAAAGLSEPSSGITPSPFTSRPGAAADITTGTPVSDTHQAASRPNHRHRPPYRPVLIPELLDDESAVQFYEDFALLAFGDSRGSVKRKGKLLRYVTAEEEAAADDRGSEKMEMDGADGVRGGYADDGVDAKGSTNGARGRTAETIECTYCWTVKRDVFEVPMVIVMNVSGPGPFAFPFLRLSPSRFLSIHEAA